MSNTLVTIREVLLQQGQKYNNKQLAQKLAVTTSMISRYKSGKHIPDLDTALRVYKLFDKTVVYPYSEAALLYYENTMGNSGIINRI